MVAVANATTRSPQAVRKPWRPYSRRRTATPPSRTPRFRLSA
ncbi:Uncharacterised protein [Bordetella pertussis]|nr:Uncharacterised protein [Bordetella pertussis]